MTVNGEIREFLYLDIMLGNRKDLGKYRTLVECEVTQ